MITPGVGGRGTAGGSHRIDALGGRAHWVDAAARRVVVSAAALSVVLVLLVVGFLVAHATPLFAHVPLRQLLSTEWDPDAGGFGGAVGSYGILAPIIGSIAVVGLALMLAVPFGVAVALVLQEVSPRLGDRLVRPAVELLLGIPSVVFGYLGLTVLVPLLRPLAPPGSGDVGSGILAAALVLSLMVLPTVAALSAEGLRAVPRSLSEASLALGATRWQTIRLVLLPGARTGILSGVVLGLARAMGEALAVSLVIGDVNALPDPRRQGVRALATPFTTMTVTITDGINQAALNPDGTAARYLLAVVLLAITFACILTVRLVQRRSGVRG